MNTAVSKRRAFLTERKNDGNRVTIGFTGIADFRSFIGQEYLAGMQKACADYGLNFINFAGAIKYSLFDDINFINHYLKNFRFMKAPLIDGLVTWASSLCPLLDEQKVINTFTALKPLPMVDIGYLTIPGVPSIRIDNSYSIEILINHLVKKHHFTKFAFIGALNSSPHKNRLDCYHKQLEKHSIQEIKDSVFMTPSMDSADIAETMEHFAENFIHNGRCAVECIVTSSDIIAEAVIEELCKRGLSVPLDVAVTGFNNQYAGLSARSPVTTLDLEYFKRGYTAVELLIDRIMEQGKELDSVLVPTSLLVRQSCGCFEPDVVKAGDLHFKETVIPFDENVSGKTFRSAFFKQIRSVFPALSIESLYDLMDAIFADVYEEKNPSEMLRWEQNLLQNLRKQSRLENRDLQQSISKLRKIIIPLVKDDPHQFLRIENIFHQLRALSSVFIEYNTVSPQEELYTMNNLSKAAINFASATTGKQVKDVLRFQLGEMGISGIILALNESVATEIGPANIELVLPQAPLPFKDKIPFKVTDPAALPKGLFPQDRRFNYILETLHYDEKYFGYAFLEVGNPNIPLCDTVRFLLSNALNQVYIREGRMERRATLLTTEELKTVLHIPEEKDDTHHLKLTSNQIINYLLDHCNEMTNLERMAAALSVSKSHLVRRAKELTGYTVQELHEKLKIEQAKNLLLIESLKLSEIAARLGFQNQNYFSSVFKKNTGMSPRSWAKKNRQ